MISTRLHVGTACSSVIQRLRGMFHIRSFALPRNESTLSRRVYTDYVDTGRTAESTMAQMANRYGSNAGCGGRHRW